MISRRRGRIRDVVAHIVQGLVIRVVVDSECLRVPTLHDPERFDECCLVLRLEHLLLRAKENGVGAVVALARNRGPAAAIAAGSSRAGPPGSPAPDPPDPPAPALTPPVALLSDSRPQAPVVVTTHTARTGRAAAAIDVKRVRLIHFIASKG